MFKRYRQLFLLLGVALIAVGTQAATYEIDAVHSQVGFRVRHIVSKVRGSFDTFTGTIEFDESKPEALMTSVVIKTTSINTANTKRDEHLRGADFFNVEKFPEMTFKSTQVKKSSESGKLQITGDFTLLGVTKPVTLDTDVLGAANDPWGNARVGFSAVGKINRKDYGMVYNTALDKGGLMLGEEVEIIIEVGAIQEKPAATHPAKKK